MKQIECKVMDKYNKHEIVIQGYHIIKVISHNKTEV